MKRMSDETSVRGWKTVDDANDPDSIRLKTIPAHTTVYEITGPIFFGASDKIAGIFTEQDNKVVILRMRSVPAVDATGIHTFEPIEPPVDTGDPIGVVLALLAVSGTALVVLKKKEF